MLSRVVCLLDPDRSRVLEILLIFLRELSKASATTLMNTHNLAIVFAPNILRSGTDNPGQVITDAKATLEIVNLLLTDPSIMTQRLEEMRTGSAGAEQAPHHAAVQAQKSEKFKRTMRENYQAIRKDSTRKLEQASRKSRVSISEFNKKMEVLSQRILDGEIDPALFDEAAVKFMDPQLIAQFSGQNEPLVTGHRANRQGRNANRNVTISGGAAINSGHTSPNPDTSVAISSLGVLAEEDRDTTTLLPAGDKNPLSTSGPASSSAQAPADAQATSPRSPRNMLQRTKPTLQRATSANSTTFNVENQVGLGLQRNRSHQLPRDGDQPSSATASAAVPTSILTQSGGGNFSLGTHRPVTVTAQSATAVPAAQKASVTLPHIVRGTAENGSAEILSPRSAGAHRAAVHRSSDPTAASSVVNATTASGPAAKSASAAFVPSSVSPAPAPQPASNSPRANLSDEEDLDDIMGDLLRPHDYVAGDSPTLHRTVAQRPFNATHGGASTNDEAATMVTLELIELLLGEPSELPEIVVPTEVPDNHDYVASPQSDLSDSTQLPKAKRQSSTKGNSDNNAADVSDEEVVETVSAFPTTGLFSSPLIASGAQRHAYNKDSSAPSMEDINQILQGN